MNYLKLALAGLLLFTLGSGIGYYFAPTKTTTEVKTDNSQEKIDQENHIITKEYDPNTGKVTKETDMVSQTNTTKKETDIDKTKVTEKSQKHYALKAGAAIDPRNSGKVIPRVGAEVALPFFNTWLGGEFDANIDHPLVGVYGRMEF